MNQLGTGGMGTSNMGGRGGNNFNETNMMIDGKSLNPPMMDNQGRRTVVGGDIKD
jgi:hypothetical protein